jgi:transcriptional regulator with PAS, ATPase and Fis domain
MRAALFFLVAAGVLPANLLHVGSPAERLFDPGDVKEVSLFAPEGGNPPQPPPDIETQMELLEAEVPQVPTDRYPELEVALKEIPIYINSAVMRHAAETVARVAPTNASVLILGPTGTGKELFANLVHRLSNRRGRPMRTVSCAAIAETLMESELFGHVKGAFTDAKMDRMGIFEAADKGTLFLDEIGELTPQAQAKLLRALEQGEIQRLGSNSVRKVDVRIVAATNVNLKKAMEDGRFRTDLYYRLCGAEVVLPPLQARREEIAILAVRILDRLNQEHKRPKSLSKQSICRLNQHSWPGNVRELKRVLENAMLCTEGDVIEPKDLNIDTTPLEKKYLDLLPPPALGFDLNKFIGTVRAHQIRKALSMSDGNEKRAADLLGISRQAVNEFLKKHADELA